MGLAAHRKHSMFNKEVQKEEVIKLNLLTTPKLMCDAHNNGTVNLFVGVPSCFHVNKSRPLIDAMTDRFEPEPASQRRKPR